VTKDGGAAGGVPEKLEAARREGCEVVVVARPIEKILVGCVFSDIGSLVDSCVVLQQDAERNITGRLSNDIQAQSA
jgi:precorrin-6x reductase